MFSDSVKPSCMIAAPDSWVRAMSGLIGLPQSAALMSRVMRTCAGLGIDLDLDARAADHPERRDIVGHAGLRVRRFVGRHKSRRADHIAGLHAVALLENLGRRIIGAFGQAGLGGKRSQLAARVLGGEPHRIAHVEGRARAERAHVIRRHVGVGMHDADVLGVDVEHLGDDLRHTRCRSPAPCRPCSVYSVDAAVGARC